MLELKHIVKDYLAGGETVHALKGVDTKGADAAALIRLALKQLAR